MHYFLGLLVAVLVALTGAPAALAADAYLSPTGSDANPCTAGSRCLTMNRGGVVANPGTVHMAAGTYTTQFQTLTQAASNVTFRPEVAGSTVTVRNVQVGASASVMAPSNVTIDTVKMEALLSAGRGETNITLNAVDAWAVFIEGSNGFTMTGGSAGLAGTFSSGIVVRTGVSSTGATISSSNVRINGTRLATNTANAVACLDIQAVTGLVVERSLFQGCESYDIRADTFSTDAFPAMSVIIENNLLFPAAATTSTPSPKAISYAKQGSTYTYIRHNTGHEQDWEFPTVSGVSFSGFNAWANVMRENDTCDTGVSYISNYVVSPTGATQCQTPLPGNPPEYDATSAPVDSTYHWLTSATRAQWNSDIQSGSGFGWLDLDYDGQTRVGCADRGADEAFFNPGETCMMSG